MGTKARDKRKRRELAQQAVRQMTAADARHRADPELMALATGQAMDPRAVACRELDRRDQVQWLTAAGWRQRQQCPDGLGTWDAPGNRLRLIHSVAAADDDQVWAHISVSNPGGSMPDWYDVREAGWLLYPGRPG